MAYFNVQKINKDVLKIEGVLVKLNTFRELYNEVTNRDYSEFFKEIETETHINSYKIKQFVDELALNTQICIKRSKMLYLHGFVLYAELSKYLNDNPEIEFVNIVETGTARGFSSLCMAKALKDLNRKGKIYTIDKIPHDKNIYWNCVNDFNGKTTRQNLLSKWSDLTDNYIEFLTGDSKRMLTYLSTKINRIHFSFLDAHHDYNYLNYEIEYAHNNNQKNDVIICDDYTYYNTGEMQYEGIIQAIDEYISKYNPTHKIYYGSDGIKKRGYVVIKKV